MLEIAPRSAADAFAEVAMLGGPLFKRYGVDGAIWSTPASRYNPPTHCNGAGIQLQPLLGVYVPKANGKLRLLGIPTMKGRAMQTLYSLAPLPIAETIANPNSYGSRSKPSTADAIEQCFAVESLRSRMAETRTESPQLDEATKAALLKLVNRFKNESTPLHPQKYTLLEEVGQFTKEKQVSTTRGNWHRYTSEIEATSKPHRIEVEDKSEKD